MSSETQQEVRSAIAIAQMVIAPPIEYTITSGSMEESESNTMILGEIITCNTCQAFLDGFVQASESGFCPVCGVHMATMKKGQERKARLIRHYEEGGVNEDEY